MPKPTPDQVDPLIFDPEERAHGYWGGYWNGLKGTPHNYEAIVASLTSHKWVDPDMWWQGYLDGLGDSQIDDEVWLDGTAK